MPDNTVPPVSGLAFILFFFVFFFWAFGFRLGFVLGLLLLLSTLTFNERIFKLIQNDFFDGPACDGGVSSYSAERRHEHTHTLTYTSHPLGLGCTRCPSVTLTLYANTRAHKKETVSIFIQKIWYLNSSKSHLVIECQNAWTKRHLKCNMSPTCVQSYQSMP